MSSLGWEWVCSCSKKRKLMMKLLFITWDIVPVLFSLGPLNIYYYSLMWILAFVMGWYVMKKILQTDKVSVELLDPLFLYAFLGVIIGARLGELFYNFDIRSEEHTSELQ